MKRLLLAAVLVLTVWGLVRESQRGTFDRAEKVFVGWLAANTSRSALLPPLSLVLYDDEASQLAGVDRMGALDSALFVRAAMRLGAIAAGVEGLRENPARMIEASAGLPVFGGYEWNDPPGAGWTPLVGEPAATWPESPGLAGEASRFSRGFLSAPGGGAGSPEIRLLARNADRAVPSMLVLAWGAAQGAKARHLSVDPAGVRFGKSRLPVDRSGSVRFFPAAAVGVMSMNELLLASENFERGQAPSPVDGHVLILARATSDVTRVERGSERPLVAAEAVFQSWDALRRGTLFLSPGFWYPVALSVFALCLLFAPGFGTARAVLWGGVLLVLLFLIVSLGLFAGNRILLPSVPFAATLLAGLLARLFSRYHTSP